MGAVRKLGSHTTNRRVERQHPAWPWRPVARPSDLVRNCNFVKIRWKFSRAIFRAFGLGLIVWCVSQARPASVGVVREPGSHTTNRCVERQRPAWPWRPVARPSDLVRNCIFVKIRWKFPPAIFQAFGLGLIVWCVSQARPASVGAVCEIGSLTTNRRVERQHPALPWRPVARPSDLVRNCNFLKIWWKFSRAIFRAFGLGLIMWCVSQTRPASVRAVRELGCHTANRRVN
jgi:hypothetical protein